MAASRRRPSFAGDVLRVMFGPWPTPAGFVFVSSFVLFAFAITGPYQEAGDQFRLWVQAFPGVLISALALTAPIWIGNQVRQRRGWELTRASYLSTIVLAAILMTIVRLPVLQSLGVEIPWSVRSVVSLTLRGIVLCLVVFSVLGIYNERARQAADEASTALREVRRQREALVETEERVRSSVSAFLHDRVQASLVTLGLQLRAIAQQVSPESARQLASLTEEVERIRDEDVRLAARRLSPDLRTHGLAVALRELGASYLPGMMVGVTITETGGEDSDESRDLAVYRIVEQALLNAAVHGQATSVTVTVERSGVGISLYVADNGSGLDMTEYVPGRGALVMDTWTGIHGGSWRLVSGADGGALLEAWLPRSEHV